MNIFIIEKTPGKIARSQCDKHAVKMLLESAQMLSVAHRVLDGFLEYRASKSGKRKVKYWKHPDSKLENILYKSVHENHPCTAWTMYSLENYIWHYELFAQMCSEYTYRYGKKHLSEEKLLDILRTPPQNFENFGFSEFSRAMPDAFMKIADTVDAYREYYKSKSFKMKWTSRSVPEWYIN